MKTPAELDALTTQMTPKQFKEHMKRIENHLLEGREDLAFKAYSESIECMNDKMVCTMMTLIGIQLNEAGV